MGRRSVRPQVAALAAACALAAAAQASARPPPPPPPAASRAAALVRQMTLAEKATLISGLQHSETNYTGENIGIERLGIPSLRMEDGPQGARQQPPPHWG